MLRIAICEDEIKQQQIIENLILNEDLSEPYELKKIDSGENLVSVYEAGQRFSIILLDMQMNELDGIKTAEIIREYDRNCIIIIVTSIIEYAIDGYRVEAYDFILKPIDQNKFSKVLRNAVHKIRIDENKTYVINLKAKISVLRLRDIVYIESNRKKVVIHYEKEKHCSNESISDVEKKLSNDGFIRVSRYFLVNIQHIREIGVKDILLSTGDTLNYSKNRREEIRIKYMNFMIGGIR